MTNDFNDYQMCMRFWGEIYILPSVMPKASSAQHSCPRVTLEKELLFSIYNQKKSKIVFVYRIFIYFCSRITKAKQYNENEL